MQTIWFKKAKKSYVDLKEMLIHYFILHNPETYWVDENGNETSNLQCDKNRSRSLEDLMMLSNHYFPGTTIEQMMKAFYDYDQELAKHNRTLYFGICYTIGRIRLNHEDLNRNASSNYMMHMISLRDEDRHVTKGIYLPSQIRLIMEKIVNDRYIEKKQE